MKKFFTVKNLCLSGIIAALYAGLTILLQAISFGPVQIRVAEAMTLLPLLTPAAVPGLAIGCFIANLLSPYGLLDVVAGSGATLLACLWTQRLKNRWLAPLPAVICNAVIVGGVIAFAQAGIGPAFWAAYVFNAVTVGLGELIASYILGSILLGALPRISFFRRFIPEERLALVKRAQPGLEC